MDSKQDRTPPVLRELVLNGLHYAVSSHSFLSLNAYCWNYSAWQLSCLKICVRYYMGLGKEWALSSEGRKVFSWGNATSSVWSFCQVYLYIYRSALAFSRTLYSVEQSFFCHKVHYPLQSQNLLILTRNTVKPFHENIAMLGPHPTNLMQWRQAIGTVKCWVASQLGSFILPNIFEYVRQCLPCCESATLQKRQGFSRENCMSKCLLEKVINSVSMW